MRFGDLPSWALELSHLIRENVLLSCYFSESMDLVTKASSKEICPFPYELLWREPLFNQLIVNIYQPGEVSYDPCFVDLTLSFDRSRSPKTVVRHLQ